VQLHGRPLSIELGRSMGLVEDVARQSLGKEKAKIFRNEARKLKHIPMRVIAMKYQFSKMPSKMLSLLLIHRQLIELKI
jgi:hypothetical protein